MSNIFVYSLLAVYRPPLRMRIDSSSHYKFPAQKGGGAKRVFICDVIGLQAIQTSVRGQKFALSPVSSTCGGTRMSAEAVKVIVRCRPMNDREKRLDCKVRLVGGRT